MPTKPTVYTFTTKNGSPVHVRPLEAEDAPYLVDLFENMGEDSRYQRFLQAVGKPDMDRVWTEAEHIAGDAMVRGRGLIAFCDRADRPDVPVAAVRFVLLNAEQAEISISVRDDMQGMGIGAQLLGLLIDEAKARDITRLVGLVQNDNMAMWHILKKQGYRMTRQPDGTYTFMTLYLDQPEATTDAAAEFSPESYLTWYK
jgi:acetyltransferase